MAAKLYFSSCFPETPENRRAIADVLRELAEHVPVVLLTTGLGLDDHAEAELIDHPRIHSLALRPKDNLGVQTQVIAGAETLLATYGGPSYLGVLLGRPTVAVESLANHNARHLATVRHVADTLGSPAPRLVDAGGAARSVLEPLSVG